MKRTLQLLFTVLIILLPGAAFAAGELSLTVINSHGEETTVSFTGEELLSIEKSTVVTENDYVSGMTTFVGPRLRTLFRDVNLKPGHQIQVTALNDYRTSIPAEEVLKYDVIVAVLMDGVEMSVRDKGPFWVIYPMSDHPELQEPAYNDRLIWQLAAIELDLTN